MKNANLKNKTMPKTKQKYEIRTFFIDDTGRNRITTHSNDKVILLNLKLESEKKFRRIGKITKSTKCLRVERKRELHLFKKGNAYGFNDYILRSAKQFDKIWLSDEVSHWKIPVTFIMENGQHLLFKQQGFELQIFVSLEQIEQFRVLKKENRRF